MGRHDTACCHVVRAHKREKPDEAADKYKRSKSRSVRYVFFRFPLLSFSPLAQHAYMLVTLQAGFQLPGWKSDMDVHIFVSV